MNKAFTLIEILISITIFSIVIIAFLSLFTSAFHYQRESLNSAYLLNSASYLTEYISRDLRMAKKDITGNCIAEKHNFETIANGIRFLNYNGRCQEFILETKQLKVGKSKSADGTPPVPESKDFMPLTPSNLEVENLSFEIKGASQDDVLQPQVTFALKLKTIGASPQNLNLQTTISQRDLDVQY